MAAPRGRPTGGRGGADCGGLGEAGAAAATAAAAGRRVATAPVHWYPPVASAAAVGAPRRRALGRREGQGGRTRQAVGHPPRDTQHGGRLCYKCSPAQGAGGEPCSVCTTLTASGERRPHQPPATPVEALRGRLHTLPFSPAGGWCRPRVRHAPPPAAAHPPPPADAPRGRLDRFPPPGDSRQRLGSNTDGGGRSAVIASPAPPSNILWGHAAWTSSRPPADVRSASGESTDGEEELRVVEPRATPTETLRGRACTRGGGGMRFQPTWGKTTSGEGATPPRWPAGT